ncbi:hypothetical protein L3Q82_012565, partial [Scortum barcoo]
ESLETETLTPTSPAAARSGEMSTTMEPSRGWRSAGHVTEKAGRERVRWAKHRRGSALRTSTEDADSIALHTALTHLQLPNTYVRNAICGLQFSLQHSDPGQADTEAPQPWDCPHRCAYWIRDFLTNRPQVVRIGDNTSSTLVLSTGTPQGCVLSPALFTLFTSDLFCHPLHKHHRKGLQTTPPRSGPHIGQ